MAKLSGIRTPKRAKASVRAGLSISHILITGDFSAVTSSSLIMTTPISLDFSRSSSRVRAAFFVAKTPRFDSRCLFTADEHGPPPIVSPVRTISFFDLVSSMILLAMIRVCDGRTILKNSRYSSRCHIGEYPVFPFRHQWQEASSGLSTIGKYLSLTPQLFRGYISSYLSNL